MLVVVLAQHYAAQLVLPAGHLRLQRALATEARSYGAKVGELEARLRASRHRGRTATTWLAR